jgi:hypothetical protein
MGLLDFKGRKQCREQASGTENGLKVVYKHEQPMPAFAEGNFGLTPEQLKT